MRRTLEKNRNHSGLTFIELVATITVLSVVLGAIVMATLGTQDVFLESQVVSQLQLRAQNTLDRIVATSSQALTNDALYSPLKPTTGVDSHGLRFRLIQSVDPTTGDPIFDDLKQVYILGPDDGTHPCQGLIIGRGPSLDAIYAAGKGADGVLGTPDDNVSIITADGDQALLLLMPSTFAPQTGTMFTVTATPAPFGRLLTFTLRVNAQNLDGDFVLQNDLVLTERVALRE